MAHLKRRARAWAEIRSITRNSNQFTKQTRRRIERIYLIMGRIEPRKFRPESGFSCNGPFKTTGLGLGLRPDPSLQIPTMQITKQTRRRIERISPVMDRVEPRKFRPKSGFSYNGPFKKMSTDMGLNSTHHQIYLHNNDVLCILCTLVASSQKETKCQVPFKMLCMQRHKLSSHTF